jgi:hypothetical protein
LKLPPAAVGDLRELNLALDDRPHSRKKGADPDDRGAILVPQGQHEKEVLYLRDTQFGEALRERFAHTAQCSDRPLLR